MLVVSHTLGIDTVTIDSGITLAALVEVSLTQASVQELSQQFSRWMTKPTLPV